MTESVKVGLPIRVCHVQMSAHISGAQRVMLDILQYMDRDRYQLHVACPDTGPLTAEADERGYRWHAIPNLVRPIRPLRDYRAYRELRALFEREQFEVVHSHSSKSGILARLAAYHAGVPCIVHHVHGYAFHELSPRWTRFLYSQAERFAGHRCHRVIFVNDEERELSLANGWLRDTKCITIPNGVDLSALGVSKRESQRQRFRRQHDFSKEEVVILFSGRIDDQKQPLILPRIAAALKRKRLSVPWRIVVQGDGRLLDRLRAQTRRNEVEDVMVFLGWRDDASAAYHGADVVLHPALWEGLPLVLLEAQAASLPIVASNVKGNREVVTPETGKLCDPHDVDQYVEGLVHYMLSPAERQRTGIRARKRAEANYDKRNNFSQVAQIYEQILNVDFVDQLRRAA